ncbi:hypothetical protein E4P42_04585 [Mycobacterium sp. PS03-16]|uniref:hypothetical protein n=1 Tax=Mycobacterium sp. PS03-16 TaxID=2559611 RepID=UPI0010730774|nr:hypothetical protein [Mycobacterium sp. PS03-16]TFV60228.1 hypothetical protein E4P42_04585 [Mycobacterium sp. PS03-16]
MANPRVWISTTARDVAVGPDGPGSHWQEVGSINTTYEKTLWDNVKVLIGLRPSAPRLTDFYLDGDANNPWVVGVQHHDRKDPFWLAIDPYGDGTRYLVTVKRATVGLLARRSAEPHPGLLDRPVAIGIRLKMEDNRVFESFGA